MMQALAAGGLEAAYDKRRNEHIASLGDDQYSPNPSGVFEISFAEYDQPDFPLSYREKLIKVFADGIYNLAQHEYKIVFMLRDPEEIRQSYEAMLSSLSERRYRLRDYQAKTQRCLAYLAQRPDVQHVVLNYRDVVFNPLRWFSFLRGAGWPIDTERAARVVDPKLYRFRREILAIGA